MKRKLTITLECGERACASAPGKFCQFMGTEMFGAVWVCCLFPDEVFGGNTVLKEKDGQLQRCEACLKAEESSF